MPAPLRIQLMDFLFDDIFNQFRAFVSKKKFRNSKFFYEISFLFKPRRYEEGEVILKQGEYFEEINLLLVGNIYGQIPNDKITLRREFNKGYFFGDFSVLFDMPSNYQFTAKTPVKVISLPKYEFRKILEKYPIIKQEIEDNSVQVNSRRDRRFTKMIVT